MMCCRSERCARPINARITRPVRPRGEIPHAPARADGCLRDQRNPVPPSIGTRSQTPCRPPGCRDGSPSRRGGSHTVTSIGSVNAGTPRSRVFTARRTPTPSRVSETTSTRSASSIQSACRSQSTSTAHALIRRRRQHDRPLDMHASSLGTPGSLPAAEPDAARLRTCSVSRGAAVAAALATASGPLPARGAAAAASVLDEPAGVAWEDGILTYVGPAGGLPWPATIGTPDRGCSCRGSSTATCTCRSSAGGRTSSRPASPARATATCTARRAGSSAAAGCSRRRPTTRCSTFCLPLPREMVGARHDRDGAEDRLRPLGRGRAAAGCGSRGRSPSGRAADVHASRCSRATRSPRAWARADWVAAACDELIPAAAAEGLADPVDIYVEDIAFSLDDLAARRRGGRGAPGSPLRVHADQLGPSGAAEAAVALGARSADHLNHLSAAGVAALGARGGTVAVLLPASSFMLRAHAAAGRRRSATPAPPSRSRPTSTPEPRPSPRCPRRSRSRARSTGSTPLEALTAATANPAFVLGLDDRSARSRWASAPTSCCSRGRVRAGAVPAGPRPGRRDAGRRRARRMIIWLNGPFGVGKTAVARALLEAKPDWALLDPEVRGAELVRKWPGRRRLPGPPGMAESRRGGRRRAGGAPATS